jgi:CRISPR-associated helicase Cas3
VKLSVKQRTVKEQNGLRIFQKSTLDTLRSEARLILVEAPVGAGKSYIIRRIVENDHLSGRPIILTYPTKILMTAQINTLKKELKSVKHWPDEPELKGGVTLFEYSSDSIVRYLKTQPDIVKLDKSELIHSILRRHQFSSSRNIIVTTPDVLHIIKEGWYRGSQRMEALLNKAIVFFDEFHLYTKLRNFAPLIKWLVESIADKVVFLSATPTSNEDIQDIWQMYPNKVVAFRDSVGGKTDRVFNYPLQLHVEECKYTKTEIMLEQLRRYLPLLPAPIAVIFDSVFRLRYLKPIIEKEFGMQFSILEYSGMQKDQLKFDKNTVILGTASLEVGVEMPIKSLITEASYWTSAIQRLGRVGRLEKGEAVLLTRKRLTPFLKDKTRLNRNELEQDILRSALKESIGTMVSSEMFRGDSYPFLVIDREFNLVMSYSEAIFAMFDIDDDFVSNWQRLDREQKKRILKDDYKLDNNMIEETLLRDRIIPFWGVVSGRLKSEYENVTSKLADNELIVSLNNSGKTYYFDHGE